jgi:hypothetical protein
LKRLWRARILKGVLKSYALGFFSAALAVLLVAAIWIGTQPKQEAGLLWGDRVYTSKQEFNGYLKSKGLSYKIWVARNPGAAPWEPDEFSVGAITVRAPTRTVQLVLAGAGWLLATAGALLLLRGGRPGMPGFAKGPVALFSVVLAGLLVGGIWFSTQSTPPPQEPALEWGGFVYTSKQEFKHYLKSKGLSYKTWVARNPGAAPWEPAPVRVATNVGATKRVREVTKTPASAEAGSGWVGRALLAAMGLLLAGAGVLTLVRRRVLTARLRKVATSFDEPVSGGPPRGSSAALTASSSTIRGVGVAASGAASRLRVSLPVAAARLVAAARADARWLANRMGERDISGGDVAYSVLALGSAIVFALVLVLVLSP